MEDASDQLSSSNIAEELQRKSLLKTNLADEISILTGATVTAQLSIAVVEINGGNSMDNDNTSIALKPIDENHVFPPTTSFLCKGLKDEISIFVTTFESQFNVEVNIDEKTFSNTISFSNLAYVDKADLTLDVFQEQENSNKISVVFQISKTPISSVLQKKNADLLSLDIEVDKLSLKMRESVKKSGDKVVTTKGKKEKTGKTTKGKKFIPASNQHANEDSKPNWWQSTSEAIVGAGMSGFFVAFEFRAYGFFALASFLVYKYGDQISV